MDLGDDQDGSGFSPGLSFTVFVSNGSIPSFLECNLEQGTARTIAHFSVLN